MRALAEFFLWVMMDRVVTDMSLLFYLSYIIGKTPGSLFFVCGEEYFVLGLVNAGYRSAFISDGDTLSFWVPDSVCYFNSIANLKTDIWYVYSTIGGDLAVNGGDFYFLYVTTVVVIEFESPCFCELSDDMVFLYF